jgi:hypothetical protein
MTEILINRIKQNEKNRLSDGLQSGIISKLELSGRLQHQKKP